MTAELAARPWGRIEWVLDRLTRDDWSILGCISTEERSVEALRNLGGRGQLGATKFFIEVIEPDGHPSSRLLADRKAVRLQELRETCPDVVVEPHDLLEKYHRIVEIAKRIEEVDSLVVDITAMPKRFFFPILNILNRNESIRDILVTYSLPNEYATGPLYEDPQSAEYLPLFSPSFDMRLDEQKLLVGMSFDNPGLDQVLGEFEVRGVEVLFPLPSPPPFFGRNWDSFAHLMSNVDKTRVDVEGVNTLDVPSIFSRICASTNHGSRPVLLAPYGPKPVSLAMCLYATCVGNSRSAVVYTQPKFYNPRYSEGVRNDGAGPVVYAYPIRIDHAPVFSVGD